MYKARYYKADGKKGKARELPASLFDGVVNEAVLHQVIKAYMANQRQGTASAKNRSAVSGGSRKPWRQKGTGRARQGTIRAVQWEGGGRAFPPIPHSWRQRVPRKVKALARRSAFNSRAEDDRIVLIDALGYDAPKTKRIREYLETIELGGRKVLLLTEERRENVYLSVRNLSNVVVRRFGTESPYDILWADTVVIERQALDALEKDGGEEAATAEAPKKKKKKAAKAEAAEVEQAPEEEAPEAVSEADEAPEAATGSDQEAGAEADDEDEEKSDA